MNSIRKMAVIPLAALIASLGCASVNNPQAVPVTQAVTENATDAALNRVPRVTADELWQKVRSNSAVVIIDSRSNVEQLYNEGHIKGAIAVTMDDLVKGTWAPPEDRDTEIVFYCSCPDEHTAVSAALILRARGYGNAKALKGGYDAWKGAGYPVESNP